MKKITLTNLIYRSPVTAPVNRIRHQITCLLLFATLIGSFFCSPAVAGDTISPEAFANPPLEARPGAYWCWLNGTVDHEQITREMEEAKALVMRGFEIWDVGAYGQGAKFIPAGPAFLDEESLKSSQHAMTEAKRLGLELNMIAAST